MPTKMETAALYIANRLAEPSTWQGIGFFFFLFAGHPFTGDWAQAAALGATFSGLLKIIFPDAAKAATVQDPKPEELPK